MSYNVSQCVFPWRNTESLTYLGLELCYLDPGAGVDRPATLMVTLVTTPPEKGEEAAGCNLISMCYILLDPECEVWVKNSASWCDILSQIPQLVLILICMTLI